MICQVLLHELTITENIPVTHFVQRSLLHDGSNCHCLNLSSPVLTLIHLNIFTDGQLCLCAIWQTTYRQKASYQIGTLGRMCRLAESLYAEQVVTQKDDNQNVVTQNVLIGRKSFGRMVRQAKWTNPQTVIMQNGCFFSESRLAESQKESGAFMFHKFLFRRLTRGRIITIDIFLLHCIQPIM